MKLQAKAIDGFLRRPDPKVRAVLLYGPDAGLVRDRALTLGRTVVPDLSDPFRVAEFLGRAIADDPARLTDEAAAISFTGGRRLIRVRDAEDNCAAAFTAFLDSPPPGDSLVVVEAGDLGTRSKLRLLFEGAETGAAIPCYVEEEASLGRVIADILQEHGLTADQEALSFLAGNLVGDRMVARGEMEKLALYMGDAKRVRLEDAEACIGDSAALSMDEPIWAAADGDFATLDRSLGRLFAEGTSPVPILRGAQRHFQRLQLIAAQVAAGKPAEAAVDAIRPPVFFKLKTRLVGQARRWSLPLIRQALERLVEAEADCKRTNMPDQTICARVLFQLSSLARR
ncbi:DNA polymerase III subunit delta [Azospirillum thermophilum]|uniref:DNA-directed DNA polymerase n=1 Tax=Azospirillum thermophilum TaxID=2202148 RepID=A0A2S2CNP5_9PROT|nr:DNA polymerase III subunit delta [Azospirillum thermophilum]AWK86055.1 DNA polymerase III subunit delta [Azospirillum thermophilum]